MKVDLKPCQAAAKNNVMWSEIFQTESAICKMYCRKREYYSIEAISKELLDGFTARYVERNVLRELCKGCKEAINDDSHA